MAKTLRPVHCPQCGSPAKTTLGPDLFRCDACQTEYYLDSDDVTVHVRHHYPAPAPPAVAPPSRRRVVLALLLGLVAGLGSLLWSRRPGQPAGQGGALDKPVDYFAHYAYADARRQPRYVALRTEATRWGSDSLTLSAVVFDPRTGQPVREQVLDPVVPRLDHHTYEWHTFRGGQVFARHDTRLLQLDRATARLTDVTQTLLARFPAASSGVAQVDFDPQHEALRLTTNDGQTLYYLPATGEVLTDGAALDRRAYARLPRRFLTLDRPPGPPDGPPQLLVNEPTGQYPAVDVRPLRPARRFFEARLLYQDSASVLISAAPTARPDAPQSLQCLDARTGQVRWARPPGPYVFEQAARTADGGFVVGYRTGPAQDYAHGALLVAANGQQERDFQRKRLE